MTTHSGRQLHCTRSAPDRPMPSRWSPDEAQTADAMLGEEPIHTGRSDSIGAQSGRWMGKCKAGIS